LGKTPYSVSTIKAARWERRWGKGFKTIRREGLDNVSLFSPYLIAPVVLHAGLSDPTGWLRVNTPGLPGLERRLPQP
jgi:hypothetical protein